MDKYKCSCSMTRGYGFRTVVCFEYPTVPGTARLLKSVYDDDDGKVPLCAFLTMRLGYVRGTYPALAAEYQNQSVEGESSRQVLCGYVFYYPRKRRWSTICCFY